MAGPRISTPVSRQPGSPRSGQPSQIFPTHRPLTKATRPSTIRHLRWSRATHPRGSRKRGGLKQRTSTPPSRSRRHRPCRRTPRARSFARGRCSDAALLRSCLGGEHTGVSPCLRNEGVPRRRSSSKVGVVAPKHHGRSRERTKTDDSLRTERKKTDEARKANRASAERDADGVVDHARTVADAVLSAARLRADHESLRPAAAGAVVGERARADLAVRGERASADVTLRSDRKDQADALAALLVHERAVTDAY